MVTVLFQLPRDPDPSKKPLGTSTGFWFSNSIFQKATFKNILKILQKPFNT